MKTCKKSEQKKVLSRENNDFVIQNEILYKWDKGKELLVVPKKMKTEIFRRTHEIGHYGIKRTRMMLEQIIIFRIWKKKLKK